MPPTSLNKGNRTDFSGILADGAEVLKRGDVDGYWRLMAPHDGYAKLARAVARNDGFAGRAANERLARQHLETHGKPIDEQKVNEVRVRIADADLKARQKSLDREGNITLKPDTIAEYHRDVFTKQGLPEDSYTLESLGRAFGDDAAGLLLGTEEPAGAERGDPSLGGALDAAGDLIDSALHGAFADGEPSDGLSRRGQHVIDRRIRERRRDGADHAPQSPSGAPAGDARSGDAAAPADVRVQTLARDYLDRLGAIDPVEAVLLKPPALWTEPEMTGVLRSEPYWTGDRVERDDRRDRVAAWFSEHFGNEPVRRDATGRMAAPAFKRPPRIEPAPALTAHGIDLAQALAGTARLLAGAAAPRGPQPAVKAFQAGLNRLQARNRDPSMRGEPGRAASAARRDPYRPAGELSPGLERVKEDGVFGPKTARAARKALAGAGYRAVARETLPRDAADERAAPANPWSMAGGAGSMVIGVSRG